MARQLILVAAAAAGTPAAFEAAANAVLAPLLHHLIGGFETSITDKLPAYVREMRLSLDVDDTGTVITSPYQVKVLEAEDEKTAMGLAAAYFTANPGIFIAPVLFHYSDQLPAVTRRFLYFLLINASLADGTANWQPGYVVAGGGAPSGPAGGDLSGTYPNPIVGPTTSGEVSSGVLGAGTVTLSSFAIASFQDVAWDVVIFKGNTRWSGTVRANISDGVTPVHAELDIVIAPPTGGTFDFTLDVDIAAGDMRLRLTTSSGGWAAKTRARVFAT